MSEQSTITRLAVAAHKSRATDVFLLQVSAGDEPAGSGMRHTDGYYAVRCFDGGAWHGRRFKVDAWGLCEAWAYFDKLTDQSPLVNVYEADARKPCTVGATLRDVCGDELGDYLDMRTKLLSSGECMFGGGAAPLYRLEAC